MPANVIENWRNEREQIRRNAELQSRKLSDYEHGRLKYLFSEKIDKYIDQGRGECWLQNPEIAQIVTDALRYFDGNRYCLHAWCVMPNHVHVVLTVISSSQESESDLSPILHSWKSFTAHRANRILNRRGKFWQDEYYDHLVRCDEDFAHCIEYTLENPVQAKLCKDWQQWPWTGCSNKIKELLEG